MGNSGGHAFIYNSGTWTDLGAAVAYSINDNGIVAGVHGNKVAIYAEGTWTDLPMPAGTTGSLALAINNQGDVVGMTDDYTPFIYSNGITTDLSDILTAAGFNPTANLWGLNDNGVIAGQGGLAGQSTSTTGFLLVPVPEPSSYAAAAGVIALGFALWRRKSH